MTRRKACDCDVCTVGRLLHLLSTLASDRRLRAIERDILVKGLRVAVILEPSRLATGVDASTLH
jgi:hypothetical protein